MRLNYLFLYGLEETDDAFDVIIRNSSTPGWHTQLWSTIVNRGESYVFPFIRVARLQLAQITLLLRAGAVLSMAV